MKTDPKADGRRELLRDAVFIVGILALCVGLFLEFGAGYALIALGVVLIAAVLLPVVTRHAA